MAKVDVFQKFEDTEIRRMQVVYLSDRGFPVDEISHWAGYAVSTIKNYAKKFAHLLDKAKEFFRYVSIKAKETILGIRQLVYLFKFYDENGELICSKVGTTTKLPEERLKQEITYYNKHGFSIGKTEICSVIDCGEIPAEGAESAARAAFIRKYPDAFHKNDRFFGVDISPVVFNRVVKNYLTEKIAY